MQRDFGLLLRCIPNDVREMSARAWTERDRGPLLRCVPQDGGTQRNVVSVHLVTWCGLGHRERVAPCDRLMETLVFQRFWHLGHREPPLPVTRPAPCDAENQPYYRQQTARVVSPWRRNNNQATSRELQLGLEIILRGPLCVTLLLAQGFFGICPEFVESLR